MKIDYKKIYPTIVQKWAIFGRSFLPYIETHQKPFLDCALFSCNFAPKHTHPSSKNNLWNERKVIRASQKNALAFF